jgi:SMODS and SLOG-associating 2TM effector domain 1
VREPDDFTALYLRLRVEEQLAWYRARASALAARHRVLLLVLYGLLGLTALFYSLEITISIPRIFWAVFGVALPVASVALATTIAFSTIGQRSSRYRQIVRALEEAQAEGEMLRRDGAAGEAVARWVQRVEDLLQTGDDTAGPLDAPLPDRSARPEVRRNPAGTGE